MDSSCSLVNKSCRYTSFVVSAVTTVPLLRGFLFARTNRKKDPRERLDESFDPTICESVVKMFLPASREGVATSLTIWSSNWEQRSRIPILSFSLLLFFLRHRESIILSWCCYSNLLISISSLLGVTKRLFSPVVIHGYESGIRNRSRFNRLTQEMRIPKFYFHRIDLYNFFQT